MPYGYGYQYGSYEWFYNFMRALGWLFAWGSVTLMEPNEGIFVWTNGV